MINIAEDAMRLTMIIDALRTENTELKTVIEALKEGLNYQTERRLEFEGEVARLKKQLENIPQNDDIGYDTTEGYGW